MYTIYGGANCPWCEHAKNLLKNMNIEFEYFDVRAPENGELLEFIRANYKTIPQIFVGDTHIGGYQELRAHIMEAV